MVECFVFLRPLGLRLDDRRLVAARALAGARETPGGGKSELRRAVRRVTPGQGDLKESGTENTQPKKQQASGSVADLER